MSQFATPRAPLTPRRRISTFHPSTTPRSQRVTTRSTLAAANNAAIIEDEGLNSFMNYIGGNSILPAGNGVFLGSDGPVQQNFDHANIAAEFKRKSDQFATWVEAQDRSSRVQEVELLKSKVNAQSDANSQLRKDAEGNADQCAKYEQCLKDLEGLDISLAEQMEEATKTLHSLDLRLSNLAEELASKQKQKDQEKQKVSVQNAAAVALVQQYEALLGLRLEPNAKGGTTKIIFNNVHSADRRITATCEVKVQHGRFRVVSCDPAMPELTGAVATASELTKLLKKFRDKAKAAYDVSAMFR